MSEPVTMIKPVRLTRQQRKTVELARMIAAATKGEEIPVPEPRPRREGHAAKHEKIRGTILTPRVPPAGSGPGDLLYLAGWTHTEDRARWVAIEEIGALKPSDDAPTRDDDAEHRYRRGRRRYGDTDIVPLAAMRKATDAEMGRYIATLDTAWDALDGLEPGGNYVMRRAQKMGQDVLPRGTRVIYVPFWADLAMRGLSGKAKRFGKWTTPTGNLIPEAFTRPGARVLDAYTQTEFLADPMDLASATFTEGLWGRLVLPVADKDRILATLHRETDAADRVYDAWGLRAQTKGRGFILLCQGPPGTGKTMTAEAIASLLKRPLLTVQAWANKDEAFLERIFSLAAKWRLVLLLDEAETFLCHRAPGEMLSNALVATMLRRLEAFDGIAVLTTNRAFEIDPAALSRMHMVLTFKAPDKALRAAIWRQSIPATLPVDGDIEAATGDGLANKELDGRQIVHAVLQAASRAAHERLDAVPVSYLEEAADQVLADQVRTREIVPMGFRRQK